MSDGEKKPIIGKWHKHKQYQCRLCAFNTLDKAVFEDHFAKVHPPLRVIDGGKSQPAVVSEIPKEEV